MGIIEPIAIVSAMPGDVWLGSGPLVWAMMATLGASALGVLLAIPRRPRPIQRLARPAEAVRMNASSWVQEWAIW